MNEVLQTIENILEVKDQGRVVIQVGLSVTLYFKGAHTPEGKASVLTCLEQYIRLFGNALRWAEHPATGAFRAIESGQVPPTRDWLSHLKNGAAWEFWFHGGEQANSANAFNVSALGRADRGKDELSYFRASVPMTFYTAHGGRFADLVLDFCTTINPFHGYGGLCILESPDEAVAARYEPTVLQIAKRFPGLEVDYPTSHIRYLREGIKGANWMVILGERWLRQIGGIEALRSELVTDFEMMEYPGGLVIQAGARPQMGDAEKGLIPELYVRLAEVLKPIRIKEHRMFHHGGPNRFDKQASEAWLARFDNIR